ncbi:hypothetical protein LEP1GSC192_1172 [Leptospira sp. B5-022]|nr:hypothetical protein LEP1GSC192_1172 [Leptospira sp. B5-022]
MELELRLIVDSGREVRRILGIFLLMYQIQAGSREINRE